MLGLGTGLGEVGGGGVTLFVFLLIFYPLGHGRHCGVLNGVF